MIGNQKPRLHSCPPFFSSLGQDAIDLAAYAGLELDPWQQFVLDESLGERRNRKWASFEVGLIVPRQNGKGAVIEARQLAAMFLTRDPMVIYSAHQFKTAKAMYRRIRDLCKQTPDLDKLVKGRYRQSNEETGIELDWGRMQFFARSNGSGRGFTGDTMFFDEAFNLDPELIADMLPTLAAVPNAQIWYVSSAGMESSEQLAKIRKRGIAGEDRLAFFEWSAAEDADLDDEAVWYQSNPGLGIRLDPDFVRSVERSGMDDERFGRERLGIWLDPSKGSIIPQKAWDAIADAGSQITGRITLCVDVTPDRSASTIAAAGFRQDGVPHVEYFDNRAGTDWVAERVADVASRHDVSSIVLDASGPAGSLIPELEKIESLSVVPVSTKDFAQACGAFFDAVVSGKVRHIGQPALNVAVDAARKRTVGDAWAWARRDMSVDISPLVACTLALHGLGRKTNEMSGEAFFL